MAGDSLGRQFVRLFKAALLVTLVVSVAGLAFLAVEQPNPSAADTQFYVLGPGGNASDYPTDLAAGETGNVIVGISNLEGEDLTYTVVFELNGTAVTTDTITVGEGATREQLLSFTPEEPGRYRLRIALYRGVSPDATGNPYRSLWLWIDVSGE